MAAEPLLNGDYRVEKVLARGGMATVSLAHDLKRQRRVALKQLHPHVAEDPEFIQRFRHEVRIHAQLHHPNILEVLEFGDGPTEFFIAMEYIDGGTLRDLIIQVPKLPSEIALFLAAEVLTGLDFAHSKGIIHRDMKPQNVMITQAGEVKVGDFGISKTGQMTRLTQTGDVIGTPAYMSPEQAMDSPLDARSDIFSTGVMLYEMLCGIHPFLTDNPVTTIRKVIDFHPDDLFKADPTISMECESLVSRMIAKRPDQRYESAARALAAVNDCLRSLGVSEPREAFEKFFQAPRGYIEQRREELSRAHLERGKSLLESKTARPEAALWELFQAHKVNQESSEASELYATLSSKTGYKSTITTDNARIQVLEEKLKSDPENVSLLLQLAKLYKLEKDFINMMRFFLKLRSLRVSDAYLEGQIASLLPGMGIAAPLPGRETRSGAAAKETETDAREVASRRRRKSTGRALLIASAAVAVLLVALVVRGVWSEATRISAKIPLQQVAAPDPPKPQGDAGAVIGRSRQIAETGDNPAALELLESWTKNGINASHPNKDDVVLELAGLYEKVGKSDQALAAYERMIREERPGKLPARAARGDLLLRLGNETDAERDFRALERARDPRWLPAAHYYLGRIQQSQSNASEAIDHFETLVRDFPQHDLANQARLLAARLRLTEGSAEAARALAQDAQQHSKVGGEIHAQAAELLRKIEEKKPGNEPATGELKSELVVPVQQE